MSHKPPLPDAATSPYPLEPAPIEHAEPAEKAADATDETPLKISGRTLGIAAGAAIGSAAVAAALIFYNRPVTPAKRPAVKPKPRRAAKPATASKPATTSKSAATGKAKAPAASGKPKTTKPRAKPKATPTD